MQLDMTGIINKMIVLFIILLVGFAANKTKIMNAQGTKALSTLLLTVNQTALVLGSAMSADGDVTPAQLGRILLASVSMYVLLFAVALIMPKILRSPRRDNGVYRFMVLFGNTGFMGYPVVASLFGDSAVFQAAVFNIPFYILVYSLGIYLINDGREGYKFDWKLLINAPLIASLLSVLLFLLKPSIPAPIADAANTIGSMTTPGAMLVIGSSLAPMKFKEVFGDWRAYALSALRLLIMPAVCFFVLRTFIADELLLGITVIIAGMPVATVATMFCMEYGANEQAASKTVVLSTILSVVTIPLLVYLLLI